MEWPSQTVESVPIDAFRPPFCPWTACPAHHEGSFRGRRHGRYVRAVDGRTVPRFRCAACRRTCSLQTFATSYYLKRPQLLAPVAAGLQAGSAHRQIARSQRCAPATVTSLAARAGRHAILLFHRAVREVAALRETVVLDHFETFAYDQEYALGLGTVVGADSWFVYALDPAPHRRAGRRSPHQARRAALLRHPANEGGYGASVGRLLDGLPPAPDPRQPLDLITDQHPAYPRAVAGRAVRHRVFPNVPRGPKGSPRSDAARRRDAAMAPVDHLHALLRHSNAHHRRETIAFGRRHNALLERAYLTGIWRNFVKRRSERRRNVETPAVRLGLAPSPWTWTDVFAKRLFPSQEKISEMAMRLYRRELVTPALPVNRTHALVRAF